MSPETLLQERVRLDTLQAETMHQQIAELLQPQAPTPRLPEHGHGAHEHRIALRATHACAPDCPEHGGGLHTHEALHHEHDHGHGHNAHGHESAPHRETHHAHVHGQEHAASHTIIQRAPEHACSADCAEHHAGHHGYVEHKAHACGVDCAEHGHQEAAQEASPAHAHGIREQMRESDTPPHPGLKAHTCGADCAEHSPAPSYMEISRRISEVLLSTSEPKPAVRHAAAETLTPPHPPAHLREQQVRETITAQVELPYSVTPPFEDINQESAPLSTAQDAMTTPPESLDAKGATLAPTLVPEMVRSTEVAKPLLAETVSEERDTLPYIPIMPAFREITMPAPLPDIISAVPEAVIRPLEVPPLHTEEIALPIAAAVQPEETITLPEAPAPLAEATAALFETITTQYAAVEDLSQPEIVGSDRAADSPKASHPSLQPLLAELQTAVEQHLPQPVIAARLTQLLHNLGFANPEQILAGYLQHPSGFSEALLAQLFEVLRYARLLEAPAQPTLTILQTAHQAAAMLGKAALLLVSRFRQAILPVRQLQGGEL